MKINFIICVVEIATTSSPTTARFYHTNIRNKYKIYRTRNRRLIDIFADFLKSGGNGNKKKIV